MNGGDIHLPMEQYISHQHISRRAVLANLAGAVAAGGAMAWLQGCTGSVPTTKPASNHTQLPLTGGKTLLTYRGHTGGVWAVEWSPDSTRIVSGGGNTDYTVQIWEAATGKRLFTYRGHAYNVIAASWSPDGKYIASGCGNPSALGTGSTDMTIQVWEAMTGRLITTYRGHTSDIHSVKWFHDGTRIVSCSADKTVQIWEAAAGKTLMTYRGHGKGTNTATWLPDGTTMVSGGDDGVVQIWEAATGKLMRTYRGPDGTGVYDAAVSPDGTRAISSGQVSVVVPVLYVWETATGKSLANCYGHREILGLGPSEWSPDSKRFISPSSDGTILMYDALTGKILFTYRGHAPGNGAYRAAWSPDGTRIASGSPVDETVQVWQAPSSG